MNGRIVRQRRRTIRFFIETTLSFLFEKYQIIIMSKKTFWFSALVSLFTLTFVTLARAADDLKRFEFSEQKMGVPVSVILYASSAEKAEEAIDAVWKRFDELDAILSDWNPESEIIRVCRETGETGDYVAVSDDLRHAFEESRRYCELTCGAFDASVGPIVKLWRRSRYFRERPPKAMLEQAKKCIGLDVWSLNEHGVRAQKNVRFDFGGIGKGIVMDEALETLRSMGINSALLNASGDLRIGDPPPATQIVMLKSTACVIPILSTLEPANLLHDDASRLF